jgi:hypothetical protein
MVYACKGRYLQEEKRESKPEPIQPNQSTRNRNESGASIHAKSKNRICQNREYDRQELPRKKEEKESRLNKREGNHHRESIVPRR